VKLIKKEIETTHFLKYNEAEYMRSQIGEWFELCDDDIYYPRFKENEMLEEKFKEMNKPKPRIVDTKDYYFGYKDEELEKLGEYLKDIDLFPLIKDCNDMELFEVMEILDEKLDYKSERSMTAMDYVSEEEFMIYLKKYYGDKVDFITFYTRRGDECWELRV